MTDPALAIATPFVAGFERFVSAPYHGAADRPGVWSIGYGFTHLPDGSAVTADTPPMTLAEADERLGELLAALLTSIRRAVAVPITDHMAAALASFAYNLGFPTLERSTLLKRLNAGDTAGAAGCFGEWVYADGVVVAGLQRRRAAEKALFLVGDRVVTQDDAAKNIPKNIPEPRQPASFQAESEADRLDDEFNPAPAGSPASQEK